MIDDIFTELQYYFHTSHRRFSITFSLILSAHTEKGLPLHPRTLYLLYFRDVTASGRGAGAGPRRARARPAATAGQCGSPAGPPAAGPASPPPGPAAAVTASPGQPGQGDCGQVHPGGR